MIDKDELHDVALSVVVIALAFAVAGHGGIFGIMQGGKAGLQNAFVLFAASIFTVGLGFVLHEMAHKYTSVHYGAHASYRAWPLGLMLALGSSLFGFIFAAPGATMIFTPYLSKKQSGIISVAGPITNILLAFAFLLAMPLVFAFYPNDLLLMIIANGAGINFWLAFFNMLPFGPLDGAKVLRWSLAVWGIVTLCAIGPLLLIGML